MNVPPPPPSAASAGSNRTLKILLVVLVFVGIPCIVGIFFMLSLVKTAFRVVNQTLMPTVSCAMNYESARDALLKYAEDHQGRLPKAEVWQDETEPYYRRLSGKYSNEKAVVLGEKIQIKAFPANGLWGCDTGTGKQTGIAFNVKLSGMKLADIQNPKTTVMLFEIASPTKNAYGEYAPKPKTEAPEVFGEARDWLTVNVEGEMPLLDKQRRSGGLPKDLTNPKGGRDERSESEQP